MCFLLILKYKSKTKATTPRFLISLVESTVVNQAASIQIWRILMDADVKSDANRDTRLSRSLIFLDD